jgi:hypothetical protein
MQVIPVDAARLEGLVCVTKPDVRTNPETGEVRPNGRGERVFLVGVAGRRTGSRKAWAIEVQTTAEPLGVVEGSKVALVEFEASPWEVEGRHGMTYRAAAVLPAETADRSEKNERGGAANRSYASGQEPAGSGRAGKGGDA